MSGTMTFTMDAQGVVDMLGAAAEGMNGVVLERLTVASTFVAELMKTKAPVGVEGALRDSIVPVIDSSAMTAEIKPLARYADAVETGSKPHWAPIDPLRAWAEMHGMNVYTLRASIAKKGTQPHPYIKPTYDETSELVPPIFASGIESFLQGLAAS